MSTSKEFHDYIMENLCAAGNVTSRRMMGEYVVYFSGRIAGNICDNCLLLRQTEASLRLLPDAETAYPYEGSKILMLVVEDVEDRELMAQLISQMTEQLPPPRPKK